MRDDRLLEIRVFTAVAELGGFSAASVALSLTQPFVSRIINQLEERLGVSLVRRSTRRISLTPEGKEFLREARLVLEQLERMDGNLSAQFKELKGEVRLTVPTSFGTDQVLPLIPGFVNLHPGVRVNLSLNDIPVNLLEGEFDIAVRMGSLPDSSLVGRKLAPLQRIVVASPAYVRQHGCPTHPSELKAHNCLMWDAALDHLNHWPFLIDGEKAMLQISGTFRSVTGITIGLLCFTGFGIARMAEHLALPAIQSGDLVPLLTEYQFKDEAGIYAVFVRDRYIHPRIRAFIDYLIDKFSPPPWAKYRHAQDCTLL